MDDILQVETLKPPLFERTGIVVDRRDAWKNGWWIGSFNLWIYQTKPFPAIVYQQRSPSIGWAPSKLDVCVAGHHEDGEDLKTTFKAEADEELKKNWDFNQVTFLGRKLAVSTGAFDKTVRNSVIDILALEDNAPLNTYILRRKEVFAVCICPIDELLKVFSLDEYSFDITGLRYDKKEVKITVNKNIFPENWDPYHLKMIRLIKRLIDGEKDLIY
jgi:transposase